LINSVAQGFALGDCSTKEKEWEKDSRSKI
jgi:hypothetical protein